MEGSGAMDSSLKVAHEDFGVEREEEEKGGREEVTGVHPENEESSATHHRHSHASVLHGH